MIQRRRRRSILFHLSILAILAFVGVFIAGLVASSAAYVVYRNEVSDFVSPDELAVNQPAVGAKILDRNGNLLYQVVSSDYGIRNPVTLDNVAPAFLAATIATEDKSFYQNAGINLQGILRASTENLNFLGGKDLFQGSGGSSITQQLVKNLYIPQDERYERSLDRKVKEVVYALEMTRRYSKDQILQWYVNQISYGGLLNGIEAASEGYFGKTASELTLAEAALIAGLPQSPAEYDPYEHPDTAIARRNEVLDLMAKMKRVQIGPDRYFDISQQDIDAAKDAPLELKPRDIDIRAPHFVLTYVMPRLEQMFGTEALQRDGLVIQTSLDLDLQNEVQGTLEKWVAQYEDASNSHNGAVTVLDSQTSQILVMLGSRDYYRKDIQGENNNLLALNSPGSSFKPFVYLTGFADLGWTPATMLDDKPTQYVESDGSIFVPHDPIKNQYLGRVTVRSALGNSLNIPAFNAAKAIGIQSIVDMAHKFGFTTFNGQYGPSIAIGGTDIRVLDLAYAYSTLARAGEMVGDPTVLPDDLDKRQMEPVSILSVKAADGTVLYDWNQRLLRTQVVSPEQAFLVTSILTDGHAECITFGCGGLQFSGMTVAVKTGTSEPFAPDGPDAGKIGETLAFGYTPDYVVGVWAGNADNSPVQNIYSTTIAYQIMHDAMLETYNGRQATPFAEPPGVTHVRICDRRRLSHGPRPEIAGR